MNSIINSIKSRASKLQSSVILPETEDPRVLTAAHLLLKHEICDVQLIGSSKDISSLIDEKELQLDLSDAGITVRDPQIDSACEEAIDLLYQRRKHKGMTRDEALELAQRPVWYGALLLAMGEAGGCVAGSIATTAEVIRSGIYCMGIAEGVKTVSSIFLMAFNDGRAYTYADCGVVPYPTEEQLADIAISASISHQKLTQQAPKTAMLSFSTHGSAQHEKVDLVREALTIVRKRNPELQIDGELQFDAAVDPDTALRKAPQSPVAGQANVYIFPNLDAGNIAYKITERLAGAQATGPILQGLAKPLMDLSRGCSPDDIVMAACVSLLMGQD
jgi:phosphate acetyltransferase